MGVIVEVIPDLDHCWIYHFDDSKRAGPSQLELLGFVLVLQNRISRLELKIDLISIVLTCLLGLDIQMSYCNSRLDILEGARSQRNQSQIFRESCLTSEANLKGTESVSKRYFGLGVVDEVNILDTRAASVFLLLSFFFRHFLRFLFPASTGFFSLVDGWQRAFGMPEASTAPWPLRSRSRAAALQPLLTARPRATVSVPVCT
mmetsp:Transcript_8858/g.22447  ORF Transcript_8858/g.22447 Transcript_8858/m.22447 type:complete len:203 (-) Transcript_8858:399-1007(-)